MIQILIAALLLCSTRAQTGCDCQAEWEFEKATYKGCDTAAPKDTKAWCYVMGDVNSCPSSKGSTVQEGSYWRYCGESTPSATSKHIVSADTTWDEGDDGPGGDFADKAMSFVKQRLSDDPDMGALEKSMSEGARLRNLWRELGHIEDAIHAANQHLKKRLIRIFKVIRAKMVKFEQMEANDPLRRSEGARLRAAWAELGHIEKEIHITNQDMKRHLRNVIAKMKSKMEYFDQQAKFISGIDDGTPGLSLSGPYGGLPCPQESDGCGPKFATLASMMMKMCAAKGGQQGWSCGGMCLYPPDEGEGNCCRRIERLNVVKDGKRCGCPDNAETMEEAALAGSETQPFTKFLEEEAQVGGIEVMSPLKKTMSEGARLRALWAELGEIEKEIHEANEVLKARLIKIFKSIRARMVNFEQEKNIDRRKSEGARLRAAWAELGEVEKEIHITNIAMKRRLKRVIKTMQEKMAQFDQEAQYISGYNDDGVTLKGPQEEGGDDNAGLEPGSLNPCADAEDVPACTQNLQNQAEVRTGKWNSRFLLENILKE